MSARERGHRETFHRLASLFTNERVAQLDSLLIRDESLGRTPLAWLGQQAAANTSKTIVAELKKLDFLRGLGAAGWDLSTINPNRLKFLAQLGRRATSQALERLVPERRYPILAAFLRQSVEEITDEVVDLYDRCRRRIQRGLAVIILGIDVTSLCEKRLHHLEVTIIGGHTQRGPAIVILGINVGPLGQQRLHHIEVAVLGGLYQRGHAGIILGIDVGPFG
jgi:hypothetical protein